MRAVTKLNLELMELNHKMNRDFIILFAVGLIFIDIMIFIILL